MNCTETIVLAWHILNHLRRAHLVIGSQKVSDAAIVDGSEYIAIGIGTSCRRRLCIVLRSPDRFCLSRTVSAVP